MRVEGIDTSRLTMILNFVSGQVSQYLSFVEDIVRRMAANLSVP